MTVTARRFVVTGRVQGVGFRAFVARSASRLAGRGWVRNRVDGSVEACAEGAPDAMEAFETALRTGPSWSRVESVHSESCTVDDSVSGFEVRSTR